MINLNRDFNLIKKHIMLPAPSNNYFLYEHELISNSKYLFCSSTSFLSDLNALQRAVDNISNIYANIDLTVTEHSHIGLICDIAVVANKIKKILHMKTSLFTLNYPKLITLKNKLKDHLKNLRLITPALNINIIGDRYASCW